MFVFVGIQFSVLAALNVSELSCSPSFLPLFSFFRRLLQSPIAYGFQISDVFFFGFSCVSVACGFACISLLATLEYFFSIEFSYYSTQRDRFLFNARVVCPDFVFKVEGCAI